MSEWKLHIPSDDNRITHYQCGLVGGQGVRLMKDLVVTCAGVPTGTVHRAGEEWIVLTGTTTDPVMWFRQPDGEHSTWDDDIPSVDEWFERI